MAAREILQLGNPLLLATCSPVSEPELAAAIDTGRDLHDTMMGFRARHGWGRAIAAPQIAIMRRIIYLHVDQPWLIINPVMANSSTERMEIWDDCMSFPDLLVRLHRHRSFDLIYRDERWEERTVHIDGVLSELLQHEIDHLDGILAVARAVDGSSFALQGQRGLLTGGAFANAAAATAGEAPLANKLEVVGG
jgi:peptide deformylase